jgi:aspartate kinase
MTELRPTILKFGGSSVKDVEAFKRVCQIVRTANTCPVVVVVSAMSDVTDALLNSVAIASSTGVEEALKTLDRHWERHREVANQLLPGEAGEIEKTLSEVRKQGVRCFHSLIQGHLPHAATEDEIVAFGEQLSSVLTAAVLRAAGLPAVHVDARTCISTDESYGKAAPLFEETRQNTRNILMPLLLSQKIPVIGGFIGSSRNGVTTTLGRGGSDYTAALVGAALRAREIQIWTDVSGVLTADPRVVKEAQRILQLSYTEAAEMAYFGAKVLHPKTVQPAVEEGVPIRICNSFLPEEEGTLVCSSSKVAPHAVKAIAHKKGITILQISSVRMLGAYGFLRALFEVFDRHQTVVDIVTTSEVSVSLSLDNTFALPSILKDLEALGSVAVENHRGIICVVGEGMRTTPGIAARVFSTIPDINVSLISQGASRVNLTFVVDEDRVEEAVKRLHEEFFSSKNETMGIDSLEKSVGSKQTN